MSRKFEPGDLIICEKPYPWVGIVGERRQPYDHDHHVPVRAWRFVEQSEWKHCDPEAAHAYRSAAVRYDGPDYDEIFAGFVASLLTKGRD